jgi:hypothetical protein
MKSRELQHIIAELDSLSLGEVDKLLAEEGVPKEKTFTALNDIIKKAARSYNERGEQIPTHLCDALTSLNTIIRLDRVPLSCSPASRNDKDTEDKIMTRPVKPVKGFYTEPEAAGYLNIPLDELYTLLDEYIFNDGSPRPQDLTFCEADLVLLGFWSKTRGNPKIVRMPRRREA